MKMRQLGSQGPQVSALGIGCMNLSMAYGGAVDEASGEALIRHAVDLGATLFDTAEMYGPFTNEVLVGRALKPVRGRVVIATKFGFRIRPGELRSSGTDSRPEHIRAVCEASLQRLGTDRIDLFYQHRVDPAVPIEEVAGAVGELVREGKVGHFGLSEAGAETLRRAHAVHPVAALQSEYSLWSRDPEDGVLAACRELGVGFVAYSPLGRGFLGGAGRDLAEGDFRRSQPRWHGAALDRNLALYAGFEALARQKDCTPAQLALAWLLHQGEDILPIPGTRSIAHLHENLGASGVRLSPEVLNRLEALINPATVSGHRYAEQARREIDTEDSV